MTQRWDNLAELVRSRLRRLVMVRGLALVCGAAVGLVWLAGIADWALHLDMSWGRACLGLGVVLASLTLLWRVVARPLLIRVSDVEIARLIEQRLPASANDLSSAAQFRSSHLDPALGSPDLQRSTVSKADRAIQEIDLEGLFVTAGAVRRPLFAAAAVGVMALASVIAAPLSARTALERLAMPFADVQWPRTTQLQLLGAELTPLKNDLMRTTAGEPLSVYVENVLGPLPDDLTLELRLPDETEQQQSLRTTLLRDSGGESHEVGIVTLLTYRGPVRFRVWGGDDDGTDWRTLEVVPAPALEDVSITLTPPEYAGREVRTIDGAGLIEGLVGSRVTIEGRANLSLASSLLHREGQSPQPMTLTEGGRRFRGEFVIEEPGPSWYWFELTDEHGLGEPDPARYELRGMADRPPVVYIDEPATDLTVTPAAALPLRVISRDDLGLTELRLRHTDAVVALLETGATSDAASLEVPGAEMVPLAMSGLGSVEEDVQTVWGLSGLGLSPGTRLTYWVEAVDACDLDTKPDEPPGQVGTSARRHLDVISESDKQRELAARQSGILDTLDALCDRQAEARDITAQLRIQAELAQRLRPADFDLLKQAEAEQREIRQQVADDSSGLAQEVAEILRELDANRIDDPESAQRLAVLASDLGDLDRRWLQNIEQSLARARKAAGSPEDGPHDPDGDDGHENGNDGTGEGEEPDDSSPVNETLPEQLRDAEEAQASALAVLADAAKLLGGWRQRFRVSSELDALLSDQKGVQQETKGIGRETMAKAASRLSAQQRADLARLSDRQRRLASRLEQLLKPPGSEPSDSKQSDSEQSSGDTGDAAGHGAAGHGDAGEIPQELAEARSWLRQQNTAGQMHQAAESLKRNEIPAAASAQENVLAALRDFAERLHQSPLGDPETLLSELHDSREQVETLRKEQEMLAAASQQALGPSADPKRQEQLQRLLKQQSGLADEAEEMARRLKRRLHAGAARTADRASQRMHDAQRALEQQQPEGVAVNQQEALDDLEQLANELDSLQQQAEGELAEQQMRQLADKLRKLADDQGALRETTADLDTRQADRGSWSRSLRRELRALADRQRELRTQLEQQQGVMDELPVAQAALAGTGETMERASALLDGRRTGEPTLSVQREAEQRLIAIVEVVSEPDDSTPGETPLAEQPPEGEPGTQQQSPGLQMTTQLKLLRRMQADVNRRTMELASADGTDDVEGKAGDDTEGDDTEGDDTKGDDHTNGVDEDVAATEAIQELRALLAREQGRIAELSRELLQHVINSQMPARSEDAESDGAESEAAEGVKPQ